eukprot:scaffold2542_cov108-Isochrysis_galbana.AAC.2
MSACACITTPVATASGMQKQTPTQDSPRIPLDQLTVRHLTRILSARKRKNTPRPKRLGKRD